MILPAHCTLYLLVSTGGSATPHVSDKASALANTSCNIMSTNLWCNVLHKKSHSQWSHLIRKLHRAIKTKLIFGKLEWEIYTWRCLLSNRQPYILWKLKLSGLLLPLLLHHCLFLQHFILSLKETGFYMKFDVVQCVHLTFQSKYKFMKCRE